MWLRFVLIIGILGLAEYYSAVLLRSSVKHMAPAWKYSFTIIYVLLTIIVWAGAINIRRLSHANLPHMVINIYITFVLGFVVGKLLATIIMLVDDIRRLLAWFYNIITRHGDAANLAAGVSRSEFIKTTAIVLAGLSVLGFSYGIRNRYRYHVRKLRLQFTALPAAFRGLKVVQISDIHTGSFDDPAAVAAGIQRVMDQKPDLILFTGDLVNNVSTEVSETYQAIFSKLRAPLGVYSTLGNHDYGDYVQWDSASAKHENLQQLKDIHAKMGWRLMMNEHIILEKGGDKIALIGIENWSDKANFPKYGDMVKANNGLKEKNIPFNILMSHDPSHWNAQVVPEYPEIQLTLSGHTHGMQFGVELPWFKWSPVQYMYKQWAGLYQDGNQYLYVNRGFGFLGYPGRLGILPEITVLELV